MGCECPDGQICRADGFEACTEPPEECGSAFEGECSLDDLRDACSLALCGRIDIDVQCWTEGLVTYRYVACDSSPSA